MEQAPRADRPGLLVPFLSLLLESSQVRQGLALLLQHVSQLFAQAVDPDRDGFLRYLEVRLELARQAVRRLRLLRELAQLGCGVGDVLCKQRVLLGQMHHQRVPALGLPLGRFRDCLGFVRLLLAFLGDQVLQKLDPLAHPLETRIRFVTLDLKKVNPSQLAQQLLVQHLDLGAQGLVSGLQHPPPRLCFFRTLVGWGRQLELGRDLILVLFRFGETLPDQCRAARLLIESLGEIRAPRIHGSEIGLLLLQQRFELAQRCR